MAQCEELIVSQLLRLDKIRRSKHRASLENAFVKLAIAEASAAAAAADAAASACNSGALDGAGDVPTEACSSEAAPSMSGVNDAHVGADLGDEDAVAPMDVPAGGGGLATDGVSDAIEQEQEQVEEDFFAVSSTEQEILGVSSGLLRPD